MIDKAAYSISQLSALCFHLLSQDRTGGKEISFAFGSRVASSWLPMYCVNWYGDELISRSGSFDEPFAL